MALLMERLTLWLGLPQLPRVLTGREGHQDELEMMTGVEHGAALVVWEPQRAMGRRVGLASGNSRDASSVLECGSSRASSPPVPVRRCASFACYGRGERPPVGPVRVPSPRSARDGAGGPQGDC